ncbi:DUF2867 domain-containing protein [Caulobacter henricii]|uniref:DUF2867 domain-containing protein n=1 Tax=Caulobacter henricii TaxID=69395 RepID=A0A0P0P2V8_9CAUL|nr:DUF2867 domain-containing protein [Caulobacter henricii]ALL14901.1 hypothetical protein AQ619_16865 [Caulobacter henricii]
MTRVQSTPFPDSSRLAEIFPTGAWFQDSYVAPLTRSDLSMPDLFFAIFAHHPDWLKALLMVRNRVAARFGLEVPSDADIRNPVQRADYRVGETIGPWPIFALWPEELVAGRDNGHLNFRLSISRQMGPGGPTVTVSTVCHPHGLAGKAYLLAVAPFHKLGVTGLLADAAAHGRI